MYRNHPSTGARRGSRAARALLAAVVFGSMLAAGAAQAAPSNDDMANATEIAAVPYTYSGSTAGATTEPAEIPAQCEFLTGGATVWFHLKLDAHTALRLTTEGSDFDTYVEVYQGTQDLYRNEVACNNDVSSDDHSSAVSFVAAPATDYLIQVGGVGSATGNLILNLTAPQDVPPVQCGSCDFVSYPVPGDYPYFAGETSIGVDPRTNAAMFLMLTHAMRAKWDDSQSPPAVSWTEVSGPLQALGTSDPILWTDQTTGRTYVAQLQSVASTLEYTDDDGATWTTAQPPVSAPSLDHQTVGGGGGALPIDGALYPNALYYCAQAGTSFSQCARSTDGGRTWGAPVPMNTGTCDGLHGHVVVDAAGVVYVPHKSCDAPGGRSEGVEISDDGGTTWHVSPVPGTSEILSDPAMAVARDENRVYFAGVQDGHPVVATSTDHGETWSAPANIGDTFGINNVEFPAAVAGDHGRAAVMFYGTPAPGNDQLATFDGVWHVYLSITTDGGATWTTQDLTPQDPVQRGCIWLQGGSNPCRNLLDFQGMTIDGQGRVLVGYADGCVTATCIGPDGTPDDSRSSRGAIARQVSGPRLLAAFDPAP